jgi:hypothetical protein
MMAALMAVLFALIGGTVPRIADRRQRLISVLAAFYLLSARSSGSCRTFSPNRSRRPLFDARSLWSAGVSRGCQQPARTVRPAASADTATAPQITERLNTTVEKLRSPARTYSEKVDAGAWWQALLQRYNGRDIAFHVNGAIEGLSIPAELFDTVADNLIENAFNKAAEEQGLRVTVTISSAHAGTLTACDNRAPVPGVVASQLFEGAVDSHTALGMGFPSLHASQRNAVIGLTLSPIRPVRCVLCSHVCRTRSTRSATRFPRIRAADRRPPSD